MRLSFCAYDRPKYVNGPNVWLVRLARELVARGHSVRVLLQRTGGPGPLSQALAELDVEVSSVARPRFTEDRVRWILERVAESPPDVFVPNLSVAGYYAGRWVREAGIPSVGVLHSDDAFHWALVDEFVRGSEPFRLSAMVCVSKYIEERLDQLSPGDVRVERIPYGVPVPGASAAWSDGRFRLAYVGRLVQPQKRVRDVVDSMCRAAREIPGVEGIIIGSGPEHRAIRRGLRASGSVPVRLAGLLEGDQVQQALLSCQGFVLLSDFEGLPVALLEAMACGVVPICLRTRSGIEELVINGESGLVVEDRGDHFVAAVRSLATDPELWRRLSQGARDRVCGETSVERTTQRWLALGAELVAASGPRGRIEVPMAPELPPVRVGLDREDVRRQPLWRLALARGRRAARVLDSQ